MGGIFHIVEDRPTPPSVYNWRVYLLAMIASCGSNMIGYTSAFIGTTITLTSFKKEFGIDKMDSAQQDLISENIVSLFIAGAFFGALLTYGLSHWIGRKWCLCISSAVFILGAGLQVGASSKYGLGILYAGRVLSGLGTGIASNIIPIYLSELSPPAIRGRLVGLYELGWQIGGMLGFWINVSLSICKADCPERFWRSASLTFSFSTASNNTWKRLTSNGSFHSPFKSFPQACSSLDLPGSGIPPDGCSCMISEPKL